MVRLAATPLTEEQYLNLERQALTKSEFHDGQMFAMAGGSLNHSLLASRMGALLDRQAPLGCRIFNSDLRIKVVSAGLSTHADCSILFGEAPFSPPQPGSLLNPLLV